MKSDRSGRISSGVQKMDLMFGVFLAGMAVYYGYRLFALTPWYDELYTYYYFISEGPLYAAIHWPLPNNHVGYSVLSAFLDWLGNPYIGLRGVSYLCALANICLLYRLTGKYIGRYYAFITVILYASMNLVNQLAVQGRGYTMGITCLLVAWQCMILICEEAETSGKIYILYALALIAGLYTVSSNVYWVVPLCLAGGAYLLCRGMMALRESGKTGIEEFLKTISGKKLVRLVAASLAAALGTVLLYATIWTAIGSNLLVKDESSAYYGLSHVKMILRAPFAAIYRGMQYMLDTPYIQSEERAGFLGRLAEWMVSLSGYYYPAIGYVVTGIWIAGSFFLLYRLIREIRNKTAQNLLLYLVLLTGILFVPVCLLIQCKRPYYRVFTYGGVFLALLLARVFKSLLELTVAGADGDRKKIGIYTAAFCLVSAFCVKCFVFSGYNEQYGTREHEIAQALAEAEADQILNFCVTDCNQQYLLYFLYGVRCENRTIEGADALILDKRMTDPDFDEMIWEFYHYYDTIAWDYVDEYMTPAYEHEDYILYTKRTTE